MFYTSFSHFLETLNKERQNKKVVFTNGCFDILHIGHVRYLEEAKKCGDLLVVALNTDESVQKLKGPTRPLQNQEDRAEILSGLRSVDFTVLFSEETPLKIIEQIKPDVLVKGGDWAIDQIVGSDFVLKNGGQVKSLQFVDDRSTSLVVDKIKKLK